MYTLSYVIYYTIDLKKNTVSCTYTFHSGLKSGKNVFSYRKLYKFYWFSRPLFGKLSTKLGCHSNLCIHHTHKKDSGLKSPKLWGNVFMKEFFHNSHSAPLEIFSKKVDFSSVYLEC